MEWCSSIVISFHWRHSYILHLIIRHDHCMLNTEALAIIINIYFIPATANIPIGPFVQLHVQEPYHHWHVGDSFHQPSDIYCATQKLLYPFIFSYTGSIYVLAFGISYRRGGELMVKVVATEQVHVLYFKITTRDRLA